MHNITLSKFLGSNTLPRVKPISAPSPTFKPNITPPVFVPKETGSPLPDLYVPAYNAQQNASDISSSNVSYGDQQNLNVSQPINQRLNYNSLQNYNTAPRGWGQNSYKPLSFSKQKSVYSDF